MNFTYWIPFAFAFLSKSLFLSVYNGNAAAANGVTASVWQSNPVFAGTLIALLVISIASTIILSVVLARFKRRKQPFKANSADVRDGFMRALNAAPVLSMMIVEGKVAVSNNLARACMGIRAGDDAKKAFVHPSDLNDAIAYIEQNGTLKNVAIELRTLEGTHRFLASFAPAKYKGAGAIVVWAMDIEQAEEHKIQSYSSRQSLQAVLDSLSVSVRVSDPETMTVVYANNACLKMFGCKTLDEMRNRSLLDYVCRTQNDGEDVFDKIKSLTHATEQTTKDVDYIGADGKTINARITVCGIDYLGKKSSLAIILDLAKENEIQKMRREIQTVIDMLPVAIRIIDNDSKDIIYANVAAAELFGVSSIQDFIGKTSFIFIPEKQSDGRASAEVYNQNMNPTSIEPITTEFTLRRLNGKSFDSQITACLIDYNGKKSSLGIIRDLTEEKEYHRMLSAIAEKERETSQLKSRFLANMSHEIRTPMNIIIGLTEIELNKKVKDESSEVYKKINMSAKNLLAIINDILDLSKIEENKFVLTEEEFELDEVLNSALLVVSPRLDGKKVEFIFNGALELPRFLIGDRTRLWQILKNFLDNSAKFTNEGKIILTVFVDSAMSDDAVVTVSFIIEDTGIGMDEEQLQRVFNPYEQVYGEEQKQYTGTGLGMVISQQLCSLMGGSIRIESTPGLGTSIRLSIPFKRSANTETGVHSARSNALAGKKILAVDDEKISRDVMNRLLRSCGANCVLAASGTEALAIVFEHRDRGEFFDVILLDYMMDDLNGLETAKQIAVSLSVAPKLLMVTAYQKFLAEKELDKNGLCGIIEKPLIPSHFISKIAEALGIKNDDRNHATYSKFKNVRVLVCDDYSLNQEVASGMLAQFGVESVVAENGAQGIEILNSGKAFDLIFMDLQMPVMDGFEATRILRADNRFDGVPIISLTADAMKETVEQCIAAGMNDHIAKPIELGRLHSILQKWLQKDKIITDEEIFLAPQNEVLARFGGNQAHFERALVEFAQLLPDEWQSFAAAVNDSNKTKKYIHKLKGAAGTLDIKDIYKYAIGFETSLRNGKPDKDLYTLLANACAATKKQINEQAKGTSTAVLPDGTAEEFEKLLAAFKESLENCSPAVTDLAEALKEKAWVSVDLQNLNNICILAEQYEFDSALDALKKLQRNV